ncbi:peptidoglycan DD-metalloendopeptidase family protein [Streptomyces sp. 5.8]|uniref:peptidoglycan DD-metalloendopeptidase family protein n=1 Tax=Streptomyces sp. 5.8 TaxID=3406571 RepID=UPI003BB5355B
MRRLAALAVVGGAAVAVLPASGAQAATDDVWEAMAQCEAGGDWAANTGNGFFGGLQFTASTWLEFGGGAYAAGADGAAKEEQIGVARQVLLSQGPGAWPVCFRAVGLTSAAGGAQSVPDARPVPDAGADAQEPAASPSKEPVGPADPPHATYKVRQGDTLGSIAAALNVEGGPQRLFEDNRNVLGDSPQALPEPGVRLSVGSEPVDTAPHPIAPAAPNVPGPLSAFAGAPVAAPVTTGYRVAGAWSSGYHTGVDFAVPAGSPVLAVADGTVVRAGWGGAYGNEVVVHHADGLYSQYAHLSTIAVGPGGQITAGTEIGLSGSTGNSTGPHLHFEVRTGPGYGTDIDPVAYLRGQGAGL